MLQRQSNMKTMLGIVTTILLAFSIQAGEPTKPPTQPQIVNGPYAQWKWEVVPFYSAKVDNQFTDYQAGGGLRGNLFLVENVALTIDATIYDPHHSVLDDASAGFTYFVPLGKSPIAFYGTLGALHDFEVEHWFYKFGAGIRYQIAQKVGATLGGAAVNDFHSDPSFRFEGALNIAF